MPSNVENILNAILTGDGSGIQKPASRVEELLFEIYEQGGGGGDSVIGGIKLTIDSNYVMTATLVDKDGEEYGVSDDIDLPLEEMVVDAEYDPQTQKIKLELKNGNYVEFSVAELVSGLQTELSSSNKLNPAYIDYDASHRAVSDTEKNTWNAKQNAISDLDTIRSGAAAGATAVQPSALETALSAKQDTISDLTAIRSGASAGATAVQPSSLATALATKQDSLDNTQLSAVNSGIDSTKVAQIETNKTNILYSLETGANNGVKNFYTVDKSTLTDLTESDGVYTQITDDPKTYLQFGIWTRPTPTGTRSTVLQPTDITENGIKHFAFTKSSSFSYFEFGHNGTSTPGSLILFDCSALKDGATYVLSLNVLNCVQASGKYSWKDVMICTEVDWNVSPQYMPYAVPNYDLTVREAEDRAALAEVVDEGAKNLFDWKNSEVKTYNPYHATVSKTESSFTITSADVSAAYGFVLSLPKGDYVLTTTISNFSGSNSCWCVIAVGEPYSLSNVINQYTFNDNCNIELHFTLTQTSSVYIMYYANKVGTSYIDITSFTASNLMICTEEEFKISPAHAPYALPNTDLTRMVNDLQKKAVKVYTYHVNPNESDPEDAVTYLDDATGLTPAKMGASSFNYGSWANAWFLPRPCMLKSDGTVAYYLNPNDYSKKTDGTASDIADANFDGNVMLEFPKIWVKRVAGSASGERTVSIAPVNVDGTYKCWSNINAEDKEVDHFYLPAYNGTIHSSKMRSLSGVTLDTTYAPDYTRAQEITAATANNPSGKNMWYTETWADMCLVYDLLYLMGKSLDVQRTFGQGLSSGGETEIRTYVTGTHNAKGLFYGDISGTSTAVKVLGMENLWGCRWHGVAGLINDSGTLKVKMTYGVADGSTTVGYNTTGSGYLNYGTTYDTNGYVKKMQADNTMGYKIIETAGTDATYYGDYYIVDNSQSNYAILNGRSGVNTYCGFSVCLNGGAANASWTVGDSLSCRPQS